MPKRNSRIGIIRSEQWVREALGKDFVVRYRTLLENLLPTQISDVRLRAVGVEDQEHRSKLLATAPAAALLILHKKAAVDGGATHAVESPASGSRASAKHGRATPAKPLLCSLCSQPGHKRNRCPEYGVPDEKPFLIAHNKKKRLD